MIGTRFPPLPGERSSGIYDKYLVRRRDGSSRKGKKHHECSYFVLDWAHDPFAVPAARAYANACEAQFPELARDLRCLADCAEARVADPLGPSGPSEGK